MKETFIQNAPLFSTLSPDEQQLIGDALKPQAFTKGESLLTQGQSTDKLFLIQSGWVKQVTTINGDRTIINNLGPGSLVGEMDLLLAQPASSSAQTHSDVSVWALSAHDLDHILEGNPQIALKFSAALGKRVKQLDRYLVQNRLRQLPLFGDLERTELSAIAALLQPLEVRCGGLIFRAGAPGDALFIVESGEVVLATSGESTSEPYRHLGPGDVLGEMAVLTGKPYDSMARASSESVLWALQRDDFMALTARYPNIRRAMSMRLSQPLSFDERPLAQERLRQLRLFSTLPEITLNAIASELVLRHYPAGELLFQTGDPGDALIIVDSGEVQLTSDDGRISQLQAGQHYGEMSLLTGKNRAHSASAIADCNVWLLYKSSFDDLLARYPALGEALSSAISAQLAQTDNLFLNQHLQNIPLFAGLGEAELRDIAAVLRSAQFERGDVIYAEGQRGDAVYFIETGEVQLATRVGDSYQMNFERLIAGDFFGEIALLTDSERKATARAVAQDTQLWVLDKADFDRVLNKYPQLALTLSKVLGERLARTASRGGRDTAPRQLKPPTPGLVAPVTRPAAARPSSVPVVKRPPSTQGKTRATPLSVKPPSAPQHGDGARVRGGVPQSKGVPARPQSRAQSRPVPMRPHVPGSPQSMAVAIRPTPRAMVPVRRPAADPVTLAVIDSVKWVADRPMGFKFRMATLTMLFVWLCGIAAPVAVLTAVHGPQVGEQLAAAGVAVRVDENGRPEVALNVPTFTPTPRPTQTATKAPTVQPTAVVAQAQPTKTPTRVPARPSPLPAVTEAPMGPVISSAGAPVQNNEFKLVKVRQLTPCENNGNHHLYVLVLDAQGNGIPNVEVEFTWDDGAVRDRTGKKVENIPALGVDAKTTAGFVNWPMYKGRARAKVAGASSDQTDWLRVDLPDQPCAANGNPIGNSTFHYSYLIVFQKTK